MKIENLKKHKRKFAIAIIINMKMKYGMKALKIPVCIFLLFPSYIGQQ